MARLGEKSRREPITRTLVCLARKRKHTESGRYEEYANLKKTISDNPDTMAPDYRRGRNCPLRVVIRLVR